MEVDVEDIQNASTVCLRSCEQREERDGDCRTEQHQQRHRVPVDLGYLDGS